MASFFDGSIEAIRPEIIRDIQVLLEYVEKNNKRDEDLRVADCASRVEKYLRDYRLAEIEAAEQEKLEDIKNDSIK